MKYLFLRSGKQKQNNLLLCIVLAPILLLLFASCGGSPEKFNGFSAGNNGVFFKLISFTGSEKKAQPGDYVFLKAVFKKQNDSIFWNSRYHGKDNYFFQFTTKKADTQFFGFLLSNYAEGDSLHFNVESALFFRDVFDTIVPWFIEKDSFVHAEIKIERILSETEFLKYTENGDLRVEAAQWQQKKSIEEWVLANMQQPVKADSLLYFEKLTISQDSLVRSGKTVTLCYKGLYMDGQLFEEVKESKPLTINYGYEAQMLRGIEKVMARLRKGESAKIIIPSHLGFGEYGSSNGSVPPNTPVVYEVKIIDVK